MSKDEIIHKADLVNTPIMKFLMLDIKGLEPGGIMAKMSPSGKVAFPVTFPEGNFEESGVYEHIIEISKKYPNTQIEAIPHSSWLNLNIPSGSLKELISEESLQKITGQYIEKKQKMYEDLKKIDSIKCESCSQCNDFKDVYGSVKNEVLYVVWEKLIAGQGEHFLP